MHRNYRLKEETKQTNKTQLHLSSTVQQYSLAKQCKYATFWTPGFSVKVYRDWAISTIPLYSSVTMPIMFATYLDGNNKKDFFVTSSFKLYSTNSVFCLYWVYKQLFFSKPEEKIGGRPNNSFVTHMPKKSLTSNLITDWSPQGTWTESTRFKNWMMIGWHCN